MLAKTPAVLPMLTQLNASLCESFQRLKGPVLLRQLLAALITRTTRKIKYVVDQFAENILPVQENPEVPAGFQFSTFGCTKEFVLALLREILKLHET